MQRLRQRNSRCRKESNALPARCWTCTDWVPLMYYFSLKNARSLCFSTAYRELTVMTFQDSYLIPGVDKCVKSLSKATIFLTLDPSSQYWQIQILEDDWDRTAFTSHAGFFHFTPMSRGLEYAPWTLQQAIHVLLTKVKWQYDHVYLKDIVIFWPMPDEHIDHVWRVLTSSYDSSMILNLKSVNSSQMESILSVMSLALSASKYRHEHLTPFPDYSTPLQWRKFDHFQACATFLADSFRVSLVLSNPWMRNYVMLSCRHLLY